MQLPAAFQQHLREQNIGAGCECPIRDGDPVFRPLGIDPGGEVSRK